MDPRGDAVDGTVIDFKDERDRHGELFAREDVLERLRGWLSGERALARGWVLLLGSPGVGKSAILSQILETLPGPTPPHHFIRRGNDGWDRPEVVVQNLCAQIEQIFPEPARADLSPETRLDERLKWLSKTVLVPHDRRLILVLDGLDEVASDGSGKNPLPRFLPRVLPPGVVILCASRPMYPHLDWLNQLDGVRRVDLDDSVWSDSNEAACRAFWEHQTGRFDPPLGAAFIDEAVRRAGGNLLHAIRLRDWLEDQPPERRVATNIPQGLSGFLTQIWTELHDLDPARRALVVDGLGIACAAREALPASLFGELLGWSTTSEAEEFLRATRPFLLEERAHNGQPAYRPYHESFREFVVQRLGEHALRQHHLRIAHTLAAWPPGEGDPRRRDYALRHAVAHRIEAGDLQGARRLCADVDYLDAKCRALGGSVAIERDLEAVIHAARSDTSLDLATVRAAIRAEASRLHDHPESLPTLLHTRLRCAGWPAKRIEQVLRFPAGSPPLRLLHGVRLGPTLLRTFLGHDNRIVACAAAPERGLVVSASVDRTLRLWSLASGACIAVLRGHDDELTACALTPDGREVISTSADATVRIWDLAARGCATTLDNGGRWATACAVTPDGQRLVVGSDNGTLTIWDRASRKRLAVLEGHTDYITACLVTPDGRCLVSASRDHSVRVWDLASGACAHTLGRAEAGSTPARDDVREEQGWITALALLPGGGQVLAARGDGALTRWDLASGRCVQRFGAGQGRVDACMILHEGRHLLCGMADGAVLVWDLPGERLLRRLDAHALAVSACAATADGGRILSASYDRLIKLWDLGDPEGLVSQDGHTAPITACAMTPDGAIALSASEDRTLKVWDIKTGACRGVLEGNVELVTACALSADGRRVLSGARDGSVWIWHLDARRGEALEGHGAFVSGCALPPNGRIFTAARDGALRLSALADPGGPITLEGHSGPVDGCAITPNGVYALSIAREGTAKLWHLESRRCERTVRAMAALLACALTPDGRRAILGREDGRIEVHDLRGQRLRVLEAHAGRVFGCTVSPDGARLISASEDRTLKVWSVESGECLGTLHGTSWFRCVAVAKRWICAGDHDGNLWMVEDGTAKQTTAPRKKGKPPEPGAQPPQDPLPPKGTTIQDIMVNLPPYLPEPPPEPPSAHPPPTSHSVYPYAALRDALARLYESIPTARIVALEAGLALIRIDPSGSPQVFWQALLEEADKRRLLLEVVQRALQDYPEDRALLAAAQALRKK